MIDIDRITEFAGTYVLKIARTEDGRYKWWIEQSDGLWMKMIEQSPYWLSLESTVEEGRTALQSHVSYDAWCEEYAVKQEAV